MRTKSFILTFLMMMFCSIGFGQASYWGDPDTHCESTMTMITQIVVDGTIQGADVEIAAFCGDELRGTVRPDETQMNMVYLVIHGNISTAGDPAEVISFRFYDHSAGRELFYPYPDIVFEDNKKIGDIEFLNTQTGIYAGDNLINFTSIAEVNNVKYGTLQAAVNAAQAGETVTLLQSATGAGVVIDKNVTIDFGGKTYTVNQAVGSAGTETLGFQILKGKTVTLMNGTLTSTAAVEGSKEIKMLIQNYAHLTLNKMNLFDTTDHILYALSNNSGNVNLVDNTNITTDAVAFDVYDYSSAGYDVPTVNVNTTGIIDGKIEVSESISNNLNISGGKFTKELQLAWCAEGYVPTEVEIDGNTYYTVHEGLLGSGTETDPFIIRSLGELKFFRDHVNAGKKTYNAEGVHVALAANIDMATEDWSVNIGDDCNKTFDGIFDGQGYTLYNLKSTETAQKADGYVCTGLFGAIYGSAVVKNLTIENVNINTGEFTGNNVAAVVGFVYGVSGKTVTIDGVKVTGDINIDASGVYGVGAIVGYSYNQGTLNIKNCAVEANDESAITAVSGSGAIIGYCGGKATIEACSVQNIDITAKGLVGGIAGITENSVNKVLSGNTVKDVTLIATKAEWVNSTAIAVGTMDGNGLTVANTISENVNASRMVGSVYAEQPTYVVPAVEARIENKYYGTFDAALAAAQEGNTITVLAPVVITEDMTYNLTGLSVVGENVYPIFRIQNGANVVVANGNISNDDYVFVLGASDGSSAGNLTIESGVYTGTTTVASVTKGLLKINGGEFKVNDSEYGATYMINCIDANYNDDSANVEIYGGKFYGFNPEDNDAEGANTNFCAQGYAANEIETGVYEVVAGMVLNQTKGIKYATLSAAIDAADANDVIVLLNNITENVTVGKSLTIDGADKNYTGGISAKGNANSTTVTVKNVNFVGNSNYAITTNSIKSITVENCTATNYSYGFLYANKSTPTVVVKDVTVNGGNYGFHWVYGTTATLENVTMTNVTNGLYIQNYAGKTINVKGCNISSIAIWERSGYSGVQTFKFEGANTVGTLTSSQYAKYVLAEADATLTAPEGANVTSGVNDYVVTYENGVYKLVVPTVKNVNTGKLYDKLQAAIDEASSGDEIEVLKDITFKDEDIFTAENYKVLVYVGDNKNITLNLNEHEIDIDYNGTSYSDLLSVVLVSNGAGLTVEGNGKITFTENSRNCAYMFFKRGTTGYLTINNGTFRMTDPEDSMIYTNGNQIVTIKGGTFILDEVGTRTTGFPLIFNASGNDANSIVVEGGTYNDDVNHQVWPSEVFIKKELALKYNDNDTTWTVVDAVAYVTEDGRTKEREVGYATLADAVNPHDDLVDNLVTVLKAHETTVPAVVERDMTIDFASLAITGNVYPVVRIQNDANVTVKNGNITNNDYVFVLGASDGSSAGNLTIESGKFHGTTTVASVTKGNLNITGGEFSVEPYQGNYAYLINCIDANYEDGSAKVSISGGTFHNWNPENNAAEGAGTNFCATGYMAEKIECEHGDCYEVIEGVYVAQVGEVKYKTVAAAVAAATAGKTVTLIANVTEDVTISKSLTIDGANFEYTGNIAVSGTSTAITVKNVNFVNGTGYAITTNRIKSVTVEDCTVKNYGYGFLYANKSTPTVVVKNVTVEDCNYGFHWVYGTTATLENVTMTNVPYGLYIQNYAGKTINVKNSTISSIAIWEKSAGVQTFNFEGANTVGTLSASQYAKYVLAAEGATLTAPEGPTVTTTVDGYKVAYENGQYCLKPCDYVAEIVGRAKYESIQDAIDAAQDGDEIDLIKSIYVTEVNNDNTTEILVSGGVSYRALYTVSGKSVTIDLNDSILYSTAVAADFLYNVFAVANGGHLTIKTDGLNGHGQVINEAASSVYSLLFCYDGTMTIENGNYNLKNGGNGRGMIYSQQDETVTVNGGKFILGNVGELDNGSPWIFNASGQNTKNIIVNGGTFNDDILHQYYPFEVMAQKEKALKYDADEELWTMVDAVAYVDEQHKSGNYYTNEVGYATLEEAVAARKYNENADHVMTVTLLKEIDLGNTTLLVDSDEDYKNSNINFDFAEKDVEGSSTPAIRIQGGANVTIKNGKMNTTGYNFILGASDGTSAGNLTIESGEYHAQTSVVSVTKGHLNITGGEFSVEPYQGNYAYLINCIDANYNNETATVAISGGKFHNWNPQNNAAEGAGTNFCADGYGAVETSANVWEVTPAQVITFETKWNWVSHYVVGNTDSDILAQLQNGLGAYGVQIKNQNYFTDYGTDPQGNTGWFGPLSNTSVTDMYKVNTSLASGESLPIQLTGAVVDPTQYPIEFAVNWNYIGYPLNESVNVETVFSGFAENGDYIKSRDQFAEYYDGMWWGDLRSMNPGEGYMYQRSTAETFTYSYPSTREAVKANVTSENNYWVPASSQYANNMTMVAMLDVKGGDYEVAAFVGGEVRGSSRPVYIESLDAYMFFLTIHGDEVEEMTFKVYDLATGEEYDLNNRMNYSNDAVVGSIGNPYLLSRGTTGIGESALTEVNIYPNPTTTGREVNLGSVCDTVEVFNALGVKIAEYQNVDTIDALETAGIYVIRITNNGNVQNCRLIVK